MQRSNFAAVAHEEVGARLSAQGRLRRDLPLASVALVSIKVIVVVVLWGVNKRGGRL